MYKGKTVAVVVPAYNEEKQIGITIEAMPDFVDRIIVVNDCSKDKTQDVVMKYTESSKNTVVNREIPLRSITRDRYNEADVILLEEDKKEASRYISFEIANKSPEKERIILIKHLKNGGVGASIATGYKWCRDNAIDCVAVMAGDGQMDPSELESICLPVIEDGIDYVKGNRLIHRSAWKVMPKFRFFGNAVLSIFTKIASGYWRISDTQCGYTAISLKALSAIRIYDIYKGYGMPNDLLVKLNIASCTIREVEIKPVYRVGEVSKMKVHRVIPSVILLLLKSFFIRLWKKYLFWDFHPLFLFYNFSFILGILCIPYLVKILNGIMHGYTLNYEPILAFIFLFVTGFQSLFFAMWMDIQNNERLNK